MRAEPNANLEELEEIERHIRYGITLPLLTEPNSHALFDNTQPVEQHEAAVRRRLDEYISFGAVIALPADADLTGMCIQPLHVIIKDGKKPRLVIDLSRNLNGHLEYEYFNYSSVDDAVEASHPGCWYGKLDLSNCFLSFPLHASVRKYFCFRFEGALYQFTHMPFGLSTAPRVCTQLLVCRPVCADCEKLGITLTFATSTTSFSSAQESEEDMARRPAARSVDHSVSSASSSTRTRRRDRLSRLSFLGVLLDSVNQTVSCTPERVEELTTLLRSLLRQRVITRGHTASLIGKLSFAAQVLPGARPFMRRMLDTLHQLQIQTTLRHPSASITAFATTCAILGHSSFISGTADSNGAPLGPTHSSSPQTPASVASASTSSPTPTPIGTVDSRAWPHHLRVGSTFSGSYSPGHAHLHQSHTQIAWCELLAVVACAATYAPRLTGQSMLFYVDNNTDVHIINRQATRSKAIAPLLRQLYAIALQHNAQHGQGLATGLCALSAPVQHVRQQHLPAAGRHAVRHHPTNAARAGWRTWPGA